METEIEYRVDEEVRKIKKNLKRRYDQKTEALEEEYAVKIEEIEEDANEWHEKRKKELDEVEEYFKKAYKKAFEKQKAHEKRYDQILIPCIIYSIALMLLSSILDYSFVRDIGSFFALIGKGIGSLYTLIWSVSMLPVRLIFAVLVSGLILTSCFFIGRLIWHFTEDYGHDYADRYTLLAIMADLIICLCFGSIIPIINLFVLFVGLFGIYILYRYKLIIRKYTGYDPAVASAWLQIILIVGIAAIIMYIIWICISTLN